MGTGKLIWSENLELAFTFAFDLEMLIRIAGYFPDWRGFFGRSRNSFDLFLAVTCSIIQIPAITSAEVYPWLTVFQLLRWYRLILAFPRMKPLLVCLSSTVHFCADEADHCIWQFRWSAQYGRVLVHDELYRCSDGNMIESA